MSGKEFDRLYEQGRKTVSSPMIVLCVYICRIIGKIRTVEIMENRESMLERVDNLNEEIRNNEMEKKRLKGELRILRRWNYYNHYRGK